MSADPTSAHITRRAGRSAPTSADATARGAVPAAAGERQATRPAASDSLRQFIGRLVRNARRWRLDFQRTHCGLDWLYQAAVPLELAALPPNCPPRPGIGRFGAARSKLGRHPLGRHPIVVCGVCVSRTHVDIDDEACATVMCRYRLTSKRETINFALRTLAAEPLSLGEARRLRGSGWESDLDEMRYGRAT